MKAIVSLVAVFFAVATPAFAGACWQNTAGDRLVFAGTDASGAILTSGGKNVDCTEAQGKNGADIACGSETTGARAFIIPAKVGEVAHDVLVWRDQPWFGCKKP